MENSSLITVIVPCWNIKNYIKRCIDSIENQTYKNIEIIAVDDLSTDGTFEELLELKKIYSNLRVYKNDSNKGAAYSRNFAIKEAKGQYIGFVDSDDYIVENYYEKLLRKIQENNLDIAITDIELVYENSDRTMLIKGCNGSVTKLGLVNNGIAASPCNKLFKKEIIQKYSFLEGQMNEDVASIIPAIINENNIGYVDGIKYLYFQRNSSVQNAEVTEKRFEMFNAIDCCLERIIDKEKNHELIEAILYQQIILLYIYVIPKQEDWNTRSNLIRLFFEKTEKYNLFDNKFLKEFLQNCDKNERKYYSKYIRCLKNKNSNYANKLIQKKNIILNNITKDEIKERAKDVIRKVTKRTVIKRVIDYKDIKKAAIAQNKMKENDIKVSVVIPNYNYEKFMFTRLYSILNQNVKIYEIIILDDCSKDNSRELINNIVTLISPYIKIKKVYNEKNSGSPFKQWKKGFELAEGDYVWIAEADDCCDKTLIKNLIKPIKKNKDIYISYADTAFIDAWDKIVLPTIKPEIDIRKTNHWESDFVDNGLDEIREYTFLNCIIANVSSCIIKKDNYDEIFEKIGKYKQAGDWLFYVCVMKRGYIAFYNKPLNYYRLHGNNVTSLTKKQKHFDEIVMIHNEIKNMIEFTKWHEEEINKRYEFLKRVWELDSEEKI